METLTVETLNLVGQLAALIGAAVLIIVAPVEMFLYGRPWVARFLKVETSNVADVRLWSFCIGARNAIGAAGALLGLYWIHSGQAALGTVLVLGASWYMLLSSLAMLAADLIGYWRPRWGSVPGTVGSSIPPAVVLFAAI